MLFLKRLFYIFAGVHIVIQLVFFIFIIKDKLLEFVKYDYGNVFIILKYLIAGLIAQKFLKELQGLTSLDTLKPLKKKVYLYSFISYMCLFFDFSFKFNQAIDYRTLLSELFSLILYSIIAYIYIDTPWKELMEGHGKQRLVE